MEDGRREGVDRLRSHSAMANSTERTPLLANGGETSPAEEAQDPSQLDPTKVPTRRRYCILAAIWTGVFLGALDTTIVATLVGSIASDFGASNEASWLATSYVRFFVHFLASS